ncbi:MAG TPA: hypothetical protein PKG60_00965 [Spirochaetota bacterium]|nr:hypothetical protein [Spirochaetota bacterium]HPS85283.1 hypothetical protein [Spirochaetota bacterium]
MSVKVKCVHCGTLVNEFTAECPNCGKPVANKDAPTNVTASPWKMKKVDHGKKMPVIPILIAVFAVIAIAIYFIAVR